MLAGNCLPRASWRGTWSKTQNITMRLRKRLCGVQRGVQCWYVAWSSLERPESRDSVAVWSRQTRNAFGLSSMEETKILTEP